MCDLPLMMRSYGTLLLACWPTVKTAGGATRQTAETPCFENVREGLKDGWCLFTPHPFPVTATATPLFKYRFYFNHLSIILVTSFNSIRLNSIKSILNHSKYIKNNSLLNLKIHIIHI